MVIGRVTHLASSPGMLTLHGLLYNKGTGHDIGNRTRQDRTRKGGGGICLCGSLCLVPRDVPEWPSSAPL